MTWNEYNIFQQQYTESFGSGSINKNVLNFHLSHSFFIFIHFRLIYDSINFSTEHIKFEKKEHSRKE